MFNSVEYWKNRKDGKRGQGQKLKPRRIDSATNEAQTVIDNDGNVVIKNRQYRRRRTRLPGAGTFTKHQTTKTERKKLRKLGRR